MQLPFEVLAQRRRPGKKLFEGGRVFLVLELLCLVTRVEVILKLPSKIHFFKWVARRFRRKFLAGFYAGSFGVGIPTRHATVTRVVESDGSVSFDREVHPSIAKWGVTLQYNLQYLQSFVRDVGLPRPFSRMIPLVEFVMRTPLDDPTNAGKTTGTIQPGIIWFGRYVQVGVEALIPVNERTGKNVGVVGQLHFYLDDILPQVFTWTPFHGVLGPTQPR